MPRILALGCSDELTRALEGDPRIEVVRATHVHGGDRVDVDTVAVGTPSSFDLVIHDCAANRSDRADAPKVDNRFLEEASTRGALSLNVVRWGDMPDGEGHALWFLQRPWGYDPPVIRRTDVDRAIFLEPFLAKYEDWLGRSKLAPRLSHLGFPLETGTPLAKDLYGDPVVELSRNGILGIGGLDDPLQDGELVSQFVVRGIFQMLPEILADTYVPDRLTELHRRKAELIRAFREADAQVDREIVEEGAFAARHAGLAQLMDDGLNERVRLALEEVFAVEVVDLDGRLPVRRGDLWLPASGTMLEVKGSRSRNARRDDVEQVVRNANDLANEGFEVRHMALLYNGQLGLPARDRGETFSTDAVADARAEGIALLTGQDLLDRVHAVRGGTYSATDLIGELHEPGRLPPLGT